ncbi:WD40 repeat domain-containing protein [Streptomyces halobius]|uniref:WD40 repeat domain-containing protein n=1 Tax=Streptomyces halobius TaxID=2879846 RepID=A0ABY4M3J8_9ACTN|nr:WD40 repeat domain-containing protein [Streptomyces halobius]UQA92337.1 WD40 repeat domain-containing protein [Streptomyces halobius]
MTTPTTPADTPHPAPAGADDGAVELFPVNFTTYRHHPHLETDKHVRAIADLLAPYGLRLNRWAVAGEERDRQAVEDRLGIWTGETAPVGSGNTVLYWVGHGSADSLAHYRSPARNTSGVSAHEIARAIGSRQLHPDTAGNWAIVVLDACFSRNFAQAVHIELLTRYPDADRYLLLSTAAEGYAELGSFTRTLDRALTVTFRGQPAVGLATLGIHLAAELGGYRADTADDRRDQLVRLLPDAATTGSAPLDQLAELQAVIDQLPTDEQRHFLPKATGAELGELAWYFHGRTLERDRILHWLTTAPHGALAVTGPAGAGKSALLGHVLLHTRSHLRDILTRHGHLHPLPAGTPCPDDPFDLVTHLSGLTLTRTLQLLADAADLPDLAQQAADSRPPADLTAQLITRLRTRQTPLTLLFDALDEAEQPLTIADLLLRPLAALPTVRVVIGTRRSTHEGPDQPAPTDTDILDTLRPRPTAHGTDPESDLQYVEVSQDPEALAGYLRAKLDAAKRRGTLHADDTHIAETVHRLVTDHQHNGAEPQQFLYARLAAHELLNDPTLLTDPTPLIGRTHRQLFTRALQRLHHTNPAYTPLLHSLGLAQGRGLPDQDGIWAHAADALTPTDTGSSIPDLLRDAAPYLALDHEHERSVYRLAHRTFTEHFTTAPGAAQAHALLTTALTHHARHTLDTHSDDTTTPPPPLVVSPYIRHHLAAHARLGHVAGALDTLADHIDVLDTLDLTSITTAAFNHGLPSHYLPPAIAGTVLLQHHARDTAPDQQAGSTTGWRRWWRRLGTTYIQGATPPTETHSHHPNQWPPTLIAGAVQRRQLHLQLTGHHRAVWAVAVFTAADGNPRLATGSGDGTVRIWDPATGTQIGEPLTGHRDWVYAVAVFTAADGTVRLATGGDDETVRIWNPATGTQIGEPLTGHSGAVRAVAVFTAADGTVRLATGGDDKRVRIWNPATGTQIGEPLTGHHRAVRAVAAFTAADGNPRLATGDEDNRVQIWDPATGTRDGLPLTGHHRWVNAVAAFTAADGNPRLATGSDDKTVRIWNPATGTQIGEPLTLHCGVYAVAAFTAADGNPRLATGSDDGTVRIWNPATGTQIGEPLTLHCGVYAVAAFTAADGTVRLATGSGDGTVRIWNPATGTQIGEPLTGHSGAVRAVAVFTAADGNPRLATGGGERVRIWDPATGTQIGEPLTGHHRAVRAVAAFTAADGTVRLATGGGDERVRIWNPATGTQIGEPLTGHHRAVRAVAAFTATDGNPRLATGGGDGTVRIWDPATGTQIGEPLTGHSGAVRAVAVFTAADGTVRLATGGDDGTVRIWDPATGTQIGEPLTGHSGAVRAVAVFTAADGTVRLATGSDDGTVRIWDPATGTQIGEPLTGHHRAVRAVAAFTAADGNPRLATGGGDETVRIWNPQSRTGHTLPLATKVHALAACHGMLIAGTSSGCLAIGISSVRTEPGHTDNPDTPTPTPGTP